MEKFTLNNEGMAALLKALYALPNSALNQQAAAIVVDFKGWLADHFVLEVSQTDYLQKLDDQFVAFAAMRCNYYLKNRLSIAIVKAEQRNTLARAARDKVVIVHEDKKGKYSESAGYTETEELNINIQYQ